MISFACLGMLFIVFSWCYQPRGSTTSNSRDRKSLCYCRIVYPFHKYRFVELDLNSISVHKCVACGIIGNSKSISVAPDKSDLITSWIRCLSICAGSCYSMMQFILILSLLDRFYRSCFLPNFVDLFDHPALLIWWRIVSPNGATE